jgi:hypothetical protein
MEKLVKAASAFDFTLPDYLADDVVIGRLVGVDIHASELRHLRTALDELRDAELEAASYVAEVSLRNRVVTFLKQRELINAVKEVRSTLDLGLADAKDYVEKIGVEIGLRQSFQEHWSTRPSYSWTPAALRPALPDVVENNPELNAEEIPF